VVVPSERLCCLATVRLREFKACEKAAVYRAEFELPAGKHVVLHLCGEHLSQASRIAKVEIARRLGRGKLEQKLAIMRLTPIRSKVKRAAAGKSRISGQ